MKKLIAENQVQVIDIKHYPINDLFFITLIVSKGLILKPGQFLIKGNKKWKIEGVVTNIKPQKYISLDLRTANNIIDCKVTLKNVNEVDLLYLCDEL